MDVPPVDLAEEAGQLTADRFYRADFAITRKKDNTSDLHGAPLLSGPRNALLSTGRFHDEPLAVTAKAIN